MTQSLLRGPALGSNERDRASIARAIMVAALTVFAFAQILTAFHDAGHDVGDDAHGTACVICLTKAGLDDALTPVAAVLVAAIAFGFIRALEPSVCRYRAAPVVVRSRGPPVR